MVSIVRNVLDRQVPVPTCRRRSSSLWFDDECRRMKQSARALERRVRRAGLYSDASPVTAEWRAQRRLYFKLAHRKRSAFWKARVDSMPNSHNHTAFGDHSTSCLNVEGHLLHRFLKAKSLKFVLPQLTQTNRHSLQHPSTCAACFCTSHSGRHGCSRAIVA